MFVPVCSVAAVLAVAVPLVAQTDAAKQEAAALAQFDKHVADYVALHRRLEGPIPPQQLSDDMRIVHAAVEALAKEIIASRRGARQGDLFTEEVARAFKTRIARCLPADELESILAEREPSDPVRVPALHANSRWPKGMPYNFVPPQLIKALPPLPPELQYRIVGRSLVLWDYHADLVVDYLPEAFPR
jgi:hypothetical protein